MSAFWTTTPDLMARELPALDWIVADRLPEGLSILIGRPKLGKSQLALNLAVAVASGGHWLGCPTGESGDVLYVDLELGQRRVKERLSNLFPSVGNMPDLGRLSWVMPDANFPALDRGLFDKLNMWREAVERPRLVVIDVYQNVAPRKKLNVTAYEADSAALKPLRDWANQHHLAVLLIHHPKKGESVDPLEMGSGSMAMASVPNLAMILDKTGRTVTLYARGHDVGETKTALRFESGWWSSLGDADQAVMSETKRTILECLAKKGPATPRGVSDLTGLSHTSVRQMLVRMEAAGKIGEAMSVGNGRYVVRGGEQEKGVTVSAAEPEKPLADNEKIAPMPVTSALLHQSEGSHNVPEAVTAVTSKEADNVTELNPSIKKDNLSTVTSDSTFSKVRRNGELFTEDELYFLEWLAGYGGKATHREAQQRCSPRLTGEQIRAMALPLADRHLIEITSFHEGMKAGSYAITDRGSEIIRGPSLF